jgi:hypothetical protein
MLFYVLIVDKNNNYSVAILAIQLDMVVVVLFVVTKVSNYLFPISKKIELKI